MSGMEPESPPYPTVRNKPMVAGAWQYREQLSMLLVPTTARASFCIRKLSSLVHFDEAMKASASGPCCALISRESAGDQVESLVPAGFAETVALADQRLGEAIRLVDEIPGELAFDAGGDAVGGAFGRLDFQDVAVLGPDIEAASDAAIGADGLGAPDARFAHGRFGFGNAAGSSRIRFPARCP